MKKKCKKCGVENQENSKFCMECGSHLEEETTQLKNENTAMVSKAIVLKNSVLERITMLISDRKKLIISVASIIVVTVIGSFTYSYYNDNLNRAKRYFSENDNAGLISLKESMSREDINEFENFLSEEGEKVLSEFNNGKINSNDTREKIKKIEDFSSRNTYKNEFLKKFEELNTSKDSFNAGLEYQKENDALQAYEKFKLVISTDTNYEKAQANINTLKPQIVDALIKRADEEYENTNYSECLSLIKEAINLDGENDNLKQLKAKYEEGKAEADKKAEEEAKQKAEEAEAAKQLINGKIIETNDNLKQLKAKYEEGKAEADKKAEEEAKQKAEEAEAAKQLINGKIIETENAEITFIDANFTTKVEPDDKSGYYLYYTSESDEIFLDLKFKVTNKGKYGLKLEGLVSNVLAQYSNGYTYRTYSCFWTENPGDISNVYSWDELDPLKTTTFHLAVKLPREVADSQDSLNIKFKILGQEQVLNFR